MNSKHPLLTAILISLMALKGCTPVNYLANQNLEFLYNKENQPINPQLKIYHPNPEDTRLYVGFNPQHFEQSEHPEKQYDVTISYRFYRDYEVSGIYDSGVKKLEEPLKSNNPDYHEISFNLPSPAQKYLIEVLVKDHEDNTQSRAFIYYYPYESAEGKHQQMLVRKLSDSEILFKNEMKAGEKLIVEHTENLDTLILEQYGGSSFKPAPPPFATEYVNKELKNLKLDSVRRFKAFNAISLNESGNYLLKAIGEKTGLPLTVYKPPFPELNEPKQLRKPLIYLTSHEGYKKLNQKKPKEAVDQFWLNITNNDQKEAKALIQYFYKRVKKANQYFTTYKKGWKTDRGMIYTVFGKPQMLYRSNNGETWIYPEGANMPEIIFKFQRRNHPLCRKYFTLDRSPHFKKYWFQMVDKIRRGDFIKN